MIREQPGATPPVEMVAVPPDLVQREVEVRFDVYGVPHIRAQTFSDLYFAQGYVAARDRLWLDNRCRPMLFDRRDIEANTELILRLRPGDSRSASQER